jgi:DNA-binding IclR family transcriptional regulator
MLVQEGPAGLAAGVLADRLGVPASSLSFHLAQLTRHGLVSQRRQSRHLIYSVSFETMNALLA